jgi:hypothetical protein
MKFSVRDLLLVTAVIALAVGWMVDRSKLAWQYDHIVTTNERLRDLLDAADPGWQTKGDNSRLITRFDRNPNPTAAYATGALLFGLAILLIVLAWQGRLDSRLFNRRLRG